MPDENRKSTSSQVCTYEPHQPKGSTVFQFQLCYHDTVYLFGNNECTGYLLKQINKVQSHFLCVKSLLKYYKQSECNVSLLPLIIHFIKPSKVCLQLHYLQVVSW